MSDDESPFARPYERLRWGYEALKDFEAAIDRHFETWPCRQVIEIDPKVGEEVVKFVFEGGLPSDVHRHANSAIEHIKNAFDQATWAASKVVSSTALRPNATILFPWTDTENGFWSRMAKKSNSIPNNLHDVIFRLKPYTTGQGCTLDDDIARSLAHIANQKHSVGLRPALQIQSIMNHDVYIAVPEGSKGSFRITSPKWNAVKNEIEVMRGPPGSVRYLGNNAQLALYVSLDEPTPLRDMPFRRAADIFAAKAQTVIETLEREANAIKS